MQLDRRTVLTALAAVAANCAPKTSPSAQGDQSPASGVWAAGGRVAGLSWDAPAQPVRSPDSRFSLQLSKADGLVFEGPAREILQTPVVSAPSLTEFAWAPSSRSFVVNASDGGLVGTWRSGYYDIDEKGRPVLRPLDEVVRSYVSTFAECATAETANFGVAGWMEDE